MASLTHEGGALQPRDEADIVEILQSHARPLEPIGGGSKRSIGHPVEADPLDLSALDGIVAYEPAELVLTARACTPLHVIDEQLAANGQRLAFEPPDFAPLLAGRLEQRAVGLADGSASARQTIGGVLSANLAGSRRVSAGAARDHFLGCRAVTGGGRRFKAGGKVVKNVTGYDLPKLLAGSWGTLAVLTEVTVRVAPAPETETTLVLSSSGADEAITAMTQALASPHDVSAAAYDPHRGCLLRVEGFEASVAARAAALQKAVAASGDHEWLDAAESRSVWRQIGAASSLLSAPVVWRLSVPPADAARVVAAVDSGRCLLDWGGGLIWAAQESLDAHRIRGALREGHATLWKAALRERRATAVFQPQPGAVAAVAARLKAAFDPEYRLNPGRMGPHERD